MTKLNFLTIYRFRELAVKKKKKNGRANRKKDQT